MRLCNYRTEATPVESGFSQAVAETQGACPPTALW